jgi:hypothetical protein
MSAEAWLIGLHLATLHSNHALQAENPGIYMRAPDGATAGVLRNSYGRTSVYGGWTFETEDQRFALTVGAITGYPAKRVLPMVTPSVRLPIGDSGTALRLTFLPRAAKYGTGVGLHASVEISF